jgi:hypothetical protein
MPPDIFWQHIPGWEWPALTAGVVAYFVLQGVRAFEGFAKFFGNFGEKIHSRATERAMRRVKRDGVDVTLLQQEMLRVLSLVERMEDNLAKSTDDLECAIAYLVDDAQWHHQVDIIFAEKFPKVSLPARIPFSLFSIRGREGWRPPGYQDED